MDSSPEYSGNAEFMLPDETDSDLSDDENDLLPTNDETDSPPTDDETDADQPKDQEPSTKTISDGELFTQIAIHFLCFLALVASAPVPSQKTPQETFSNQPNNDPQPCTSSSQPNTSFKIIV